MKSFLDGLLLATLDTLSFLSFFLLLAGDVTRRTESEGFDLIDRMIAACIERTRCCLLSPSNKSQ